MTPQDPAWGIDPLPGQLSRLVNGAVEPPQPVHNERGRYTAYYAAVREAVLGRADNPVPPSQALDVMTVLEAGLQSAREQRAVRLDAEQSRP